MRYLTIQFANVEDIVKSSKAIQGLNRSQHPFLLREMGKFSSDTHPPSNQRLVTCAIFVSRRLIPHLASLASLLKRQRLPSLKNEPLVSKK